MLTGIAPAAFRALSLHGKDAPDFLQRLTTANLRLLEPGQSTAACFLTAQGRFESFFILARLSGDHFLALVDVEHNPGGLSSLTEVIERYLFSEKVDVTEWPQGSSFVQLSSRHEAPARETEVPLPLRWFGQPAKVLLLPAGTAAPAGEALTGDALEALRIQQLYPRAGREITPDASPVEVGVPDAVAPNKGCYPGQEVIEKVIALGSPARRLVRIQGPGPAPEPGNELTDSEGGSSIGKITSSIGNPEGGFRALGIVRKTHAKEGLALHLSAGSTGRIDAVADYKN
jgi:folate-binding protein YgfZ